MLVYGIVVQRVCGIPKNYLYMLMHNYELIGRAGSAGAWSIVRVSRKGRQYATARNVFRGRRGSVCMYMYACI